MRRVGVGRAAFRATRISAAIDRQARFRDEGYRRPYTGRFSGRRTFGGDDDRPDRSYSSDRGWSERWERAPSREFTGTASGLHDPHYSEWRRRQIDALDRDYDEYRRENQNRFENEFSDWRTTRQGKRQLLGDVREHMSVVGSDEELLGTVDCVRGDRIILTKGDSEDGRASFGQLLAGRPRRRRPGDPRPAGDGSKAPFGWTLSRNAGSSVTIRDRESGPHMLNRAFSGTYER